jgi:phosphotriesterase-related protein
MSEVQTMHGAIDSSQLGRVLVHEHIFLTDPEFIANYRPDFDEDALVAGAAAELDELKAQGIDTIIDLTVLGLGRDIPRIAKVAERTKLQIVVATGVYSFDHVPEAFAYWGPGLLHHVDEDPMIGLFVKDITEGIAGTRFRAGALKCAIDKPGMTPGVERIMRAVAQAHLRTGAPISVHTAPHQRTGLDAQRVFCGEGVDLRDVIIGHSGDSTDIDYLMELADQGSILGMDRFGIDFVTTTPQRVATIIELVKRGYADRLALSHDCACWAYYLPSDQLRRDLMPNHRYSHVCDTVVPALLEGGVSQRDVDTMFIDNPRRHFEGSAARFAQSK